MRNTVERPLCFFSLDSALEPLEDRIRDAARTAVTERVIVKAIAINTVVLVASLSACMALLLLVVGRRPVTVAAALVAIAAVAASVARGGAFAAGRMKRSSSGSAAPVSPSVTTAAIDPTVRTTASSAVASASLKDNEQVPLSLSVVPIERPLERRACDGSCRLLSATTASCVCARATASADATRQSQLRQHQLLVLLPL